MIDALALLDRKLFLVINSWHTVWLNPVMELVSGQAIWIPFIALIFWVASKQLDKKAFWIFILFLVLGIIASDVSSSYILKNVFERMRPCRLAELKPLIYNFGQRCGGRYGFVSSHAANTIFILTFSFGTLNFRTKIFHLLWILPFTVSYSRIYLGVHYPGDILGGLFVGISWGLILSYFFKNKSRCQSA